MILSPLSFITALMVSMFTVAASPSRAEGPVLLTVTGSVTNINRGPFDPAVDQLFAFHESGFETAHEFDHAALAALPVTSARTDFPMDGPQVLFTGPALADVLAAAGGTGTMLTIEAMDGYAIRVSIAELVSRGAVLALARDGKPLGIGGFGPAQIVFPRSERPDLADMNDDWWIWQIYHISVE